MMTPSLFVVPCLLGIKRRQGSILSCQACFSVAYHPAEAHTDALKYFFDAYPKHEVLEVNPLEVDSEITYAIETSPCVELVIWRSFETRKARTSFGAFFATGRSVEEAELAISGSVAVIEKELSCKIWCDLFSMNQKWLAGMCRKRRLKETPQEFAERYRLIKGGARS